MDEEIQREDPWDMEVTTDAFPRDVVMHRGNTFPRTLVATFRRADIEVALDIRVEKVRGPVPISVTIRSDEGVSGRDAQQPVIEMARRAARPLAFAVEKVSGHEIETAVYVAKPERHHAMVKLGKRPARRAAALEDVASWYREALANGEPVGRYVADKLGLGIDRAYQLIREARSKGFLPQTRKGRKQA